MISVYLAGPYSDREQIRLHRDELKRLGVNVTAQWVDDPSSPAVAFGSHDPEERRTSAVRDINDVTRADVFLFFSVDPEVPMKRGGRHVEFGVAVALRKRILVIGPRENIFHFLPEVEVVASWQEALAWLLACECGPASERPIRDVPFRRNHQ